MYLKLINRFSIVLFCFCFQLTGLAQSGQNDPIVEEGYRTDELPAQETDSASIIGDNAIIDTVTSDTSFNKKTTRKNKSTDAVEDPVNYSATDSINIVLSEKKIYLYGEAKVTYQSMNLEADYIEFDMDSNIVFARGVKDSMGIEKGRPVFTDGDETFESENIFYNFKSKKGVIRGVITEQEGGYLHGAKIKRHEDEHIDIKGGKYTTCDKEHPHFYLSLTKAKVIPNDKIISGPAYLVLADIPFYFIGLPFGFFPNTNTSKSGVLVPEYGEEKQWGFFLKNGGYYFALSEYFDLRLTADIYSKGTWGTGIQSNYKKRYAFNGGLRTKYYNNVTGEKGTPEYSVKKDFSIKWNHRQAPEANPNSSFSADVDFSTSSYDNNHSYNSEQYLTNTKSSSISYNKIWPNSPFNLSANLRHSQNSKTEVVDFTLPQVTLNMNRIYPFQNDERVGKAKWYENVSVGYTSNLENRINTYDSLLFTSAMFDDASNGFRHNIPVNVNFKPIKNFTITPNLNYNGMLYPNRIEKSFRTYSDEDTTYSGVFTDTINELTYVHGYYPGINFTYNPKIYGMFQVVNPEAKIQAVRHVITPSAQLSFLPDMKDLVPDYYRTYYDSISDTEKSYSIVENSMYGTPTLRGKSGKLRLGLQNILEMKVRTPEDTTRDNKKVTILERLNLNTNYDLFADSLNWSTVSMVGGTRLFNNNLDLKFNGTFDPYAINKNGRRINKFEIDQSGKLVRMTNLSVSLGTSLSSSLANLGSSDEFDDDTISDKQKEDISTQGYYNYFDIPWNINVDYSLGYTNNGLEEPKITQTLRLSGNLKLTKNWKMNVSSGYDFENKELTYTKMGIYRDLHCWEMKLDFVPFGNRKYYSFQINVKSSVLKDLKYQKKKNWRDY